MGAKWHFSQSCSEQQQWLLGQKKPFWTENKKEKAMKGSDGRGD
jgi:hypothetical protein